MIRYSRNPDALHAEVGGDFVVMSMETLQYFEFNPVGRRVWELLETGPLSLDEMTGLLLDEYDVTADRARNSVAAFLAEAQERGFVDAG